MIREIKKGVFEISFDNFGSIVYLLFLEKSKVLIDTSSSENREELIFSLRELNLGLEDIDTIILTHGHYDHVENVDIFPSARIYGNFSNKINRDHGQTKIENILPVSELENKFSELKVFCVPGHTPGDIVILYENILFSGDVIFHGGYIGRNDFPESNPEDQIKSLQVVSNLKFDILCPGH